MFQDMGHTGSIGRIRLEADTKDIVLVVPCHVEIVRIGLVMGQPDRCEVELGNVLLFLNSEAVKLFADAWEGVNVGHSRC